MKETRLRTWLRVGIWRLSGVVLATIISGVLTRDWKLGIEFGVAYNTIRLFTHYAYERITARIPWGFQKESS